MTRRSVARMTPAVTTRAEAASEVVSRDGRPAGGRPLDGATRARMEGQFAHDFSHVRAHTGPEAAASARAANALAYTVGDDIVFASGQYRPDTTEGRRLLSHELAHTIEQRERGQLLMQRQGADEPKTSPNDTASSVFPYEEGARVLLSALFPDRLFGYAPNGVSNWVHGVNDESLNVIEGTPDRVRLAFSKPATPRGPGAGPPISGVSITIDRVGPGQLQISIQAGASTLTFQAARAARDAMGATVLVPVASKARQLPGAAASPTGDFTKSDAAPPPGLESPSKPAQDKAVLDSISKPSPTQDDFNKQDKDSIKKLLSSIGDVFSKSAEFTRLSDAAEKQADKLPTVVVIAAPLALVAAAFRGMVATKDELPVSDSPDIVLKTIGDMKMKLKVTYDGRADLPKKVAITFTFAKGSLEVAPAFTATWRDPAQPGSLDNKTGIEAGLSVKIPLGPKPPAATEPTDTEKTRADASRLQDEQDKFRSGVTFKPGTPDARQAQAQKQAIDDVVRKPLTPGTSTPSRLIANFDTSWNFEQIARQTEAGFAASPGATLQVVAFFTPVAGDGEAARAANSERQDAATEKADTTRQALEKSIAVAKGRVRSSIELTGGGRTFGLPPAEAKTLGQHQVAIILIAGSGGSR